MYINLYSGKLHYKIYMVKYNKEKTYYNKNNKSNHSKNKLSSKQLLSELSYKSSRDAEWYKRTLSKIDEVKKELDSKFLSEEQRKKKLDFIRILKTKIKDYKDARNNTEIYKKVRFFERRKLERMLKQINTKIENNKDKSCEGEMLRRKEEIIDDINYVKVSKKFIKQLIKHFPINYKYYSLFPKNNNNSEETKKKRIKIRNKIKIYLNTKLNLKKKLLKNEEENIDDNDDFLNLSDNSDIQDKEKYVTDNNVNNSKENLIDNNNNNSKINNIESNDSEYIKNKTKNKEKEKEHKKLNNKNSNKDNYNIKSLKNTNKIRDYEDENLYKNALEKDDFFIME